MDTISTSVRIITDGGDLISYTEYDTCDRAWTAFTDSIAQLRDGELAQLIEDDLIAAEHNPEFHGHAAHDVGYYA